MADRRLADVCEAVVDCPHSTPVWTDSGVIVLRNQNIRGGRLDLSSPSYTDEKHFEERTRRIIPQKDDLVITREAPMGEACLLPPGLRCCLGQRMVLLRVKASLMVPRYLLYALQSPEVQHEILVNEGTGSTVSNLRIPVLESLPIPCPPLTEQKRIARVLGTLDDKIELNRRMNATLEGISRAIFKSWFVDFDPVRQKAAGKEPIGMDAQTAALFPYSFEDSEIGEVPTGWGVGRLSDITEHPRRAVQPAEIPVGTPYIGLEHMPRRCIALSDWGEGDGVESNKFEFQRGEILFGKLRPYFHKVGVAPVDGVCSTDIVVARPIRPEWFGVVLGVMSSDEFVAYTNAASTGTKMPRTNWDDMSRYEVVLPPERVAEAFTALVRAAVDSIAARIHQSHTLAALRDTLLPKLLSGEVRVPEAEEAVEEVLS